MKLWACLAISTALWSQGAPKPARVVLLEARPGTVKVGNPVELAWTTQDATRVVLEPPGEEVLPMGRRVVTPQDSTVYWLHATNLGGGQSVPVAVTVEPEPKPAPTVVPGFWIQFAALANEARAREIQGELGAMTGQAVHLSRVEAPTHPGLTLHRIRQGPFPSRKAAQLRLREIRAGIQVLGLKPVVMAE